MFSALRQLLTDPLPELVPPQSMVEHQQDFPRRRFIPPSSKLLLSNFFEASALVGFVGLILLVAQARTGLWNLWAVIGGIVIIAWMIQAMIDAQNQPTLEHYGFSQVFGASDYQREKAKEIFLTTLTGSDILAIIYHEYRLKSWFMNALNYALSTSVLVLLLIFIPQNYPIQLLIVTLPVPILVWVFLRFHLNSRMLTQAISKRFSLIAEITFKDEAQWSRDQLDLWYLISGQAKELEEEEEEDDKEPWWQTGIGCLYQIAFYGFLAVMFLLLVSQFVPNPPWYAQQSEPYLPIVLLIFALLLVAHHGAILFRQREKLLERLEKFDAIYRMFTLVEAGRE